MQMIGTSLSSVGDNWTRGEPILSKITLGFGPINFTIGKGQKLLQLENNLSNLAFNLGGIGYAFFSKKSQIDFDWKNLTFVYKGQRNENTEGLGIFSISGGLNLDMNHESIHLWHSRALNEKYYLNYVFGGIRGIVLNSNIVIPRNFSQLIYGIIDNSNYYETIAYGHEWWK